jgi:serine/threonine-protein kinase
MQINLKVVEGPHTGREFTFEEHDNFLVGRARFAHFRLPQKDKFFSRVHFLVEVNPPHCRLMDMKSTNGTVVNGKKVVTADLTDGDLIRAGQTVLLVSLVNSQAPSGDSFPVPDLEGVASPRPRATPAPGAPVTRTTPLDSLGVLEGQAPRVDRPEPPPAATPRPAPAVPALAPAVVTCKVCASPLAEARPREAAPPLCQECQAGIRSQPQPIPGYSLVRTLGEGGMGVVYLGLRNADGSLAAVKTVKPAIVGSRVQVERFLREARILEQLDHPHIVSFREMGDAGGLLYFALDFVPGADVADLLEQHRSPLPVPRAVGLACQMLEALEYAHARKIVHRDIKPANLLVESKGGRDLLRVTDFGLARTYQASQISGLTMRGDFGGTAAYMPPEQVTNFREAKPPADQYSAAATLYRLLTNHNIYNLPREIPGQLMMIMYDEPVPILTRRPELPRDLAAVIHRGLAKDPAARFADVGAMRRALEPFGQ